VDLARPRFEEASEDTPVTVPPLPDEPQSLNSGAAQTPAPNVPQFTARRKVSSGPADRLLAVQVAPQTTQEPLVTSVAVIHGLEQLVVRQSSGIG
jgi:hypothetical protein